MNYKRIYNALIERAKGRFICGYVEKHHIIPKCMGGWDLESNLVALTPEEHYVAHQLLVKIYPGHRGLVIACHRMAFSGKYGPVKGAKFYGWLRRRAAILSPEQIAKSAAGLKAHYQDEQNRERQRILAQQTWDESPERKEQMSDKLKEAWLDENYRARQSAAISAKAKERWADPEFKEKVKGMMRHRVSEMVVCPHCGVEGSKHGMGRWHFDNCRSKS